jgi:hypothetical protein
MNRTKETKETKLKTILIDLIYIFGFIGLFTFTIITAINN